MCFTFPALLNPGKVSIVIEPVVAIINNQVEALKNKGIDAVALGRAAGNKNHQIISVSFKALIFLTWLFVLLNTFLEHQQMPPSQGHVAR